MGLGCQEEIFLVPGVGSVYVSVEGGPGIDSAHGSAVPRYRRFKTTPAFPPHVTDCHVHKATVSLCQLAFLAFETHVQTRQQ